ncbi:TetR/AcrR family transcriptional regulator [Thermomonospora cellulosilytica]|uniref:AcrR family transcriptional regulator n=1 Tax=Thermomonospora cellulosilytica TaxID=1411118 RepID=A0A7W3RA31_9ACTN|nr:TetR/AcrR family transcriptional regulator [Thermomonospora cellulosilytica]MBA9005416.1 AcrR family transcriptional regulator [Thermomonospora cellulosilytica]
MEAHDELRRRGEEAGYDRIHAAARRLFAQLGYDGTTTEMIADAAGVDRQEVVAAGGRAGLYRRVLERFHREQCEMLDRAAEEIPPDADRMRALMDRVLDFYLGHLEGLAIWQQRAMSDAADMTDLEELYRDPVHQRAVRILGADIADNAEFQMLFSVFGWCLSGFAVLGIPLPGGPALEPEDPHAQALFREYMTELLDRLRPR